jgi:3',5'-cyclic-AMP phosphodiesterase
MIDVIRNNRIRDGDDRRGFLKCVAWAGTGAVCVMKAGVLKSYGRSEPSTIGAATGEQEEARERFRRSA